MQENSHEHVREGASYQDFHNWQEHSDEETLQVRYFTQNVMHTGTYVLCSPIPIDVHYFIIAIISSVVTESKE
jgi:hypothetical protein